MPTINQVLANPFAFVVIFLALAWAYMSIRECWDWYKGNKK